jgi:RNA polymerase sigma-70 factor (ECF subfamily)
MIEDRLLILGLRLGRPQALRQVYDKYKVALLRLAVVLAGDAHTAEDIVHDVFVRFAQSADRVGPTGSLRSYLTTSVVNGVRNHVRDSRRHAETTLEQAELHPAPESGPPQWAILSEELASLSEALQQLPCEQREAVCCHIEMGMPLRQIAVLQKVSLNTAKGRYRYGIERLRVLLDGKVER